MARLRVDVTETDIQTGVPNSSSHCPVARAFKRMGLDVVWVGCATVALLGVKGPLDLPDEARQFIRRFDCPATQVEVMPFSFEMEIEREVPDGQA